MKRTMKTWALVAVAAMGLTACQNDFEEQVEAKDSVVVTFVADSADTRTSVDTSGDTPLFAWGENETFAVLEQTDELAEATSVVFEKVDGKAHITAEFATNEDKAPYSYVTVYPASGYVEAESIDAATLTLPVEQTMANGSYDPAADLMVSEVKTTDAQPTEAQMVGFHRIAAVVKMSISNLAIGAGEQIEKVEFMANGKHLAGEIVVDLNNPATFTPGAGSNFVSVATTASDFVYFTVLPTTLEAGDTYGVAVVTDKKAYVKVGTIPEGKSLDFQSGMVTRFGVNMQGVNPSDKWVLVRDASTLKQNDVVTIAAKNYNYVIGKPSTSVYPLASQTEAIKVGNYLYHNPADESADHMMQTYTLMQRDVNRTAFDFYNGVDFVGDTNYGFAWATGSNNTPKLQAFCDKNTLFDVSIAADGVATITASDISGSYKYWRYYHANSATSRKFDLTSSEITDDARKILLYKLEGAVGTIPTIAAVVTVPDIDEPVVIAEEGAAEATAIDAVVFNYVGDWTISVSDNADWLTVAYDEVNTCLTYTAEENTDVARDATVRIIASMDGQDDIERTFTILQKGAPMEVSIEEFLTKEVSADIVYKLTGKVKTISNSNSGTYTLEDESGNNTVDIRYLYFEGTSNKVYDSDILKVGDIVTVTAVVYTKGKVGGSSTNHAIYKGHYGITASAGLAADYTGGAVTITVTTRNGGSMTLPEVVVATMPESDYATLTYDGGNTATVTFTSENTTSDAREATVTFTYGDTSVEVTVEQGINPANRVGWNLVTDASTLKTGDEIVIVAKNVDKALGCLASSAVATGVSNFPAVEVDKSGKVVYDVEKAGALVFTLQDGNSAGTFALQFTHKDTNYYLYAPSSGLKGRAASSGANDDTSYEIIIDATSGDATVKNARPKVVKYNNATGTTFLTYSPTATNATKDEFAICIYRK